MLDDIVTLYYDPNDITNIDFITDNYNENWVGFLIAGILCIIISWVIYYVVKRYAFAQTLTAFNFGLNVFRR